MEKATKKSINTLRKFFEISTAAFEFQERIVSILGMFNSRSHMHLLHIAALKELNKDNPDLGLIDALLAEMERIAEKNKKESPENL